MAEKKKTESVGIIQYNAPVQTAYGKALTMGWFGKISPDEPRSNVGAAAAGLAIFGATFGGLISIMAGIGWIFGMSLSAVALAWPALFVTSLAVLCICARATDKRNQKLLADPTENFDWQIAKTVKSFNNRVTTFNSMLAAIELGKMSVPEDELERAYNELSSAREELKLHIRMLEGMRETQNTEPELAVNLEELKDAKEVLMRELRQSEYPNKALSAGKTREVLQNECAYRELPFLLKAKK